MDGGEAATGITSPYVYNPGNSASHTYVVRAINGTCFANSGSLAAADEDNSTTPTIGGDAANVCPATTVTLTTEAGMSSYQWYGSGFPIGGANSSSYVTSSSGIFTVSYENASGCTGTSGAHAVTI